MRSVFGLVLSATVVAASLVAGGLTSAEAGRNWWVTARVHPNAEVTDDGAAWVNVTYRCKLPRGNPGSTEVYSTLTQHSGTPNERWAQRIDWDEFTCGGQRTTLEQAYSPDSELGFHPGRATLRLEVRACTGEVSDDPGKCVRRVVVTDVRLRPLSVS